MSRTYEVVYQRPATVSHTETVELPDSEKYPEPSTILSAIRKKLGNDVVSISGYAEVLPQKENGKT